MNLRVAIALALLTIVVVVPGQAYAAGAYPFDGIPGISPAQHLEAVVLIEDLRALRGALETQREDLLKTAIGKSYFSPEHQKSLLGADIYTELDHVIAVVAPKGASIPAVLAFVSAGDDVHVQLAIKTESGVTERLLAAKTTGGFRVEGTASALTVVIGERTLPAKVDGSWLRIGVTEAALTLSGTPPLQALPPTFAKWAADSQIVIAALGGGKLAETIAGMVGDDPIGQGLVRSTRAFGLTLRYDRDGSQVARVVLDADRIKDFA
ncbi:MAG: hypothetical protein H7Z43_12995, partial [Clostridia bacterium]|nr:hypothetical protein [Deltaproteobacteria bacterium]